MTALLPILIIPLRAACVAWKGLVFLYPVTLNNPMVL